MQSNHLCLSKPLCEEQEILNEQIATDTLIIEDNQNELDAPNNNNKYGQHLLTNLSEVSEELISTDKIAQVILKESSHHIEKPSKVPQKQCTESDEIIESENTINEEGKINKFYDSPGTLLSHLKDMPPEPVIIAKSIEDSKYSVVNPLISENTVHENIKTAMLGNSMEDRKIRQSEKALDKSAFNEFTTNSSSRECCKKEKLDLQIDLGKEVKRIEEKYGEIERQRQSTMKQIKQEALRILLNKAPVHESNLQRRNSNQLQRIDYTMNERYLCNINQASSRTRPSELNISHIHSTSYISSPSSKIKSDKLTPNLSYCNHKKIIHALSMLLLVGESNSNIRNQVISIIQRLHPSKNVVILLGAMLGKCEYRGSYIWNTSNSIKLIHSYRKCPNIVYSSMIKDCYHYDCANRDFRISNIPWLSAHTDGITLEYI